MKCVENSGPQQVSAHLFEAKTASHIDMVLADLNWLNVPEPDLYERGAHRMYLEFPRLYTRDISIQQFEAQTKSTQITTCPMTNDQVGAQIKSCKLHASESPHFLKQRLIHRASALLLAQVIVYETPTWHGHHHWPAEQCLQHRSLSNSSIVQFKLEIHKPMALPNRARAQRAKIAFAGSCSKSLPMLSCAQSLLFQFGVCPNRCNNTMH